MEMKGEGGHRTSRLEGPGIRIQVGKGSIAFFDLRQPGGFVAAYAVSVRAFEHRAEPIKRPDVLLPPRLRVVLRGDRRNQEGPVRCLQEEELSRELRQDSTRDWTLAPANRPRGLDERIFRAIHFLPNPARVVIQPDPMMTALAPRAFREADRGTRRMLGEKARGGCRLGLSFEFLKHGLPAPRALQPPTAKKLGVGGGDDGARMAGGRVVVPKSGGGLRGGN